MGKDIVWRPEIIAIPKFYIAVSIMSSKAICDAVFTSKLAFELITARVSGSIR